jgi:3-oxoacyl-[acyl-carrier-protein] synthase II
MIETFHSQPVVANLAAISSLGEDWPSTWEALLAGKRAVDPFPRFELPFTVDVQVSGIRHLERDVTATSYGAACRIARSVLDQLNSPNAPDIRLYGASNHGETDILLLLTEQMPEASALWRALLVDPMPEYLFGERGTWIYSACTSSLHALAAALLDGEDGQSSDAVVVSADALSAIAVAGFWRAGATTRSNCSPFREDRDGILIGEGAAALHLSMSSTGLSDEIRVLGFGMSCDAGHPTDPDLTGNWLEQAVRDSIARAGLVPDCIAAVVSHGTGTIKNDAAEALAYRRLWPNANVPVTSVKGALGHTMGAAGLFNVLVAIEASRRGILPPSVGPSSKTTFDLDLVLRGPREINVGGPVLAVASGFGGNNFACVVGVRA